MIKCSAEQSRGFWKSISLLWEWMLQIERRPKKDLLHMQYMPIFKLMLDRYFWTVWKTHYSKTKWDACTYNAELLCTDSVAMRWSSNCKSDPSQILNQKRRLNLCTKCFLPPPITQLQPFSTLKQSVNSRFPQFSLYDRIHGLGLDCFFICTLHTEGRKQQCPRSRERFSVLLKAISQR